MSIFILFVSTGVLFEAGFSLSVSLKHFHQNCRKEDCDVSYAVEQNSQNISDKEHFKFMRKKILRKLAVSIVRIF